MVSFELWDEDDDFEAFEKFRKAPKVSKEPARRVDEDIREARRTKAKAKEAVLAEEAQIDLT